MVSGVVSWVYRIQKAFRNHPKYQVILAQVGTNVPKSPLYDVILEHQADFNAFFEGIPEAIVIPNWVYHTIPWLCELNQQGARLHIIGIGHSDTAEEYYNPLIWAEPGISHYVGVSPVVVEALKTRLPHRKPDVTEIVYGIDVPDDFHHTYQTNPIRLIYAGRIVQKQKRVMDFALLVQALLQYQVDFHFTIAGEGTEEEALRQALAYAKRGRRVSFIGAVAPQDMAALWRAHDVFLQVSDYEGTSVSMLEAMAEGAIPIVSDASSGVRNVIRPGRNGFVAPVGQIEVVAAFIQRLVQNPHWLPVMGHNAYQTATQYTLPQHAKQYEALFDRVRTGSPPMWRPGHPVIPQFSAQ